ncbi:MAG: T9SS type A sorting domain-containing protein, partial [Sphingobacteriales bacterium]
TINNSKYENFKIVDLNGKIQKKGKVPQSQQLDLTSLNSGMYLLILNNASENYQIKILKK